MSTVNALKDIFEEYRKRVPPPYLYPSPEGKISHILFNALNDVIMEEKKIEHTNSASTK